MRRVLQVVASIYVLIPLIVGAAAALAYYSYRYANQLARRGEQSIMDTTAELANIQVSRVEELLVKSDETLFNSIDLQDLRAFRDVIGASPAVESAVVLDEKRRIVPDSYKSKKRPAEAQAFRERLEAQILPTLRFDDLELDEHRYLHQEFDGRYYLISHTRRRFNDRDYFIVLEADLAHLITEVFPDYFSGVAYRRVYQVVDERGNIVFGHPFSGIAPKYVVSVGFPETLTRWRLRMAPREAPNLVAKQSVRRAFDVVLIALSAGIIFVGLGLLTVAVRTAQHANQLKSDFIANVSHELKTPLSLIRMFGELLATGRSKGPETAREYAEIITRESERLSRLIDNVLDFARIERGKEAYTFQIGDLAEVLSRGLDVYRYRLDREGMKLQVDIAEDLPPVRIDENAMTLVLLNLVDNAVKYAADGKELRVSLSRHDDRVLLAVRDRGPGIPPEECRRIFDRFYRAKSVRGRPVRGSGIGLSLVKHIAEAHGGGIAVESEVGAGSTFTVWIPADVGKSAVA